MQNRYAVTLLAGLLNEFYRYDIAYFPIIEEKEHENAPNDASRPFKLLGFLLRSHLDRWVTDIERLDNEYKSIPSELIQNNIKTSELLETFPSNATIPVLNQYGISTTQWNENQFLQALAQIQHKKKDTAPASTIVATQTKWQQDRNTLAHDNSRWMAELLLKKIPWPLYACDLEGKTLFFNHLFEEQILTYSQFRNSIKAAENYLKELTRNLLAESFMQDPQRKYQQSSLNTYDASLRYFVQMQNLEENKRVHGYLFIFQNTSNSGFQIELEHRIKSGASLNNITEGIEAQIIYNTLKSYGRNITHAANALQIKRSTLQNRKKRLEINNRFASIASGPVRRKTRQSPKKATPKPNSLASESRGSDIQSPKKKIVRRKTNSQNEHKNTSKM